MVTGGSRSAASAHMVLRIPPPSVPSPECPHTAADRPRRPAVSARLLELFIRHRPTAAALISEPPARRIAPVRRLNRTALLACVRPRLDRTGGNRPPNWPSCLTDGRPSCDRAETARSADPDETNAAGRGSGLCPLLRLAGWGGDQSRSRILRARFCWWVRFSTVFSLPV